ncbi:putative F-box domain, leucine-rich repeat domain superfamily, F-box-like domain superfamily [Helianthus annuus]|nr:putative F-box domain, leucine-rich repeat domain superfamily, F-box-like domain superfamily [Helianthus annuus]
MHTELCSPEDYISDLPESIIETILAKLPITEAVRTSVLSSKWRYKWTTLTELKFDDNCVSNTRYRALAENSVVRFVNHFLLLHNGPINRFTLSSACLRGSAYVDQWLLLLSRKDVQELSFRLGQGEWFKAHSSLFSCKKLIGLELVRFCIAPDAVETLVSSCTLLESLTLSYFEGAKLTIRAPNLKYLMLEGEFKDICLENTPMLVVIFVAMYMTEDIAEHFKQSSSCNFDKLLGGVPSIQRLTGRSYFTKYMSLGIIIGDMQPIYQQLKVIELSQVGFEDEKEIMVILRLILSAPNLQVLQIRSSSLATNALDLDIWDKECLRDVTFKQLKVVKLTQISGLPHEMRFIEFLLGSSPVLEVMDITQNVYVTIENEDWFVETLGFERASAEVEFRFADDQA